MFDHDYFMREAHTFLSLLGTRSFWNLPADQREGALSGLSHAYFKAEGGDVEQERLRAVTMNLAMADYNRRSVLVALHPRAEN